MVLDVYRHMAHSAGISLSRCLGEWLADTADAAQLVAAKMLEAKRAPVRVMQEMQAMLHGAHEEAGQVLGQLRRKGVKPVAMAAPPTARPASIPPSSNTGGYSPSQGRRKR